MLATIVGAMLGAQALSGADAPYLCNFGRATTRRGDVIVHAAASATSKSVARVRAGAAVYICDERGDWYEIHFDGPNRRCPIVASGLSVRRASTCPSGWVRRNSVTVLSG